MGGVAGCRSFVCLVALVWSPAGGNQREIDRQRAAKRAEKGGKNKKKEADGPNAKQLLTNKKEKYVMPHLVCLVCFWLGLLASERVVSVYLVLIRTNAPSVLLPRAVGWRGLATSAGRRVCVVPPSFS